ncbi:ABC transporter substrate-binding protein [Cellulomonas massiliensis]|uniref:ABC transporter substrate-binding protein n=1 Tax=Cellulomonas massiliensis TaxID=1465811 RepID=UPI0003005DCC|nr:extracellular solute-binding protein [Cellulomonas massiliensis]
MKKRILSGLALGASVALLATACSTSEEPGGSGSGGTGGEKVTLTVWENNTAGEKGPKFWADTKAAFEKDHPNVTIEIVPVPNEDLDGKLQTAMNGGNPPDVFLQRGGGKLAEMVAAGMVADITDAIDAPDIPEGAFGAGTLNGKRYSMPMSVQPGGLWYSKDLFKEAGIDAPPTTWPEFTDAVTKLQDAGITPVALGAKDAWPAAHWFYWFALRQCSSDTLEKASNDADLSDPCFLKAGELLQEFSKTNPFQDGFLTTPAQNTPDSSDGLMAQHKAAMQLMGSWEPGTVGSLTESGDPLPDMGFFPFPEIEGGQGQPGSMMGGMDAFSCSSKAEMPACTDFLNFLGSASVQAGFATANSAIPASSAQEAQATVTLPALQEALAAYGKAPYVSMWLDTRLGQNIGNALNTGIVDMLAGKGSPQAIIDGANAAAAKG